MRSLTKSVQKKIWSLFQLKCSKFAREIQHDRLFVKRYCSTSLREESGESQVDSGAFPAPVQKKKELIRISHSLEEQIQFENLISEWWREKGSTTGRLPGHIGSSIVRTYSKAKSKLLSLEVLTAFAKFLSERSLFLPDEQEQLKQQNPTIKFSPNTKEYKAIRYNEQESIAYMITRSCSVYLATFHVLQEIKKREPDFRPNFVLDFGSGIGSSVWACDALWKAGSLGGKIAYECIDISPEMVDLADQVMKGLYCESLADNVSFRRYLPEGSKGHYDMVIASYTLSDIVGMRARKEALKSLWEKTADFLVIIEYGTKDGFHLIQACRDEILNIKNEESNFNALGDSVAGYAFSPCNHNLKCPKTSQGSCNLTRRLSLPAPLLYSPALKEASFIQESFCYVVLRKGKKPPSRFSSWGRIVSPIHQGKGIRSFQVCEPNGCINTERTVSKRCGKDMFQAAKNYCKGDFCPSVSVTHYHYLLNKTSKK